MELLHHGVDQSVIALWLGHESVETTQIYIHADMRLKEKALAGVAAPETRPGRFRPDDELLAWLEALCLCRTAAWLRSEEHTSELQSLMRNSYAVFCLKK